jgi:hypothetical protein
MYFELSIYINRPPADVFTFLRDKHAFPQEPGSPVLILDKTSPGPARLGTHYREVVQMFPGIRGEILSEITRFEPCSHLEEDFHGAGMEGHLAYEFIRSGEGTQLIQRYTLHARGFLKISSPLMRWMLAPRLLERLETIKSVLESGWQAQT